MSSFNVGVLGIGDISDVYIDNLRNYPVVHILACAGRDQKKAEQKAYRHGIARAYSTAAELFADPDIDIVLNLTVPKVHGELTLAALRAGKHVYTEKPLAATFEEGREILALAKARGLYVGCAPDTFLGGRLQTCREIVDDGRIGKLVGAAAFAVSRGPEWFHPNPGFLYERGGGPMLDIGPYYLSALVALFGPVSSCIGMTTRSADERVVESAGRRGQRFPVEEPTHVSANLAFASGAVATLIFSYDVWDSALPRMELYGDAGTICLDDPDPCDGPNIFGGRILLRTRDNYRWKELPRGESAAREWENVAVSRPFRETSHRENSRGIGLVDMACAIRDGCEPRASASMGLHVLEIMHGIDVSSSSGSAYRMETSFERPVPLHNGFSSVND